MSGAGTWRRFHAKTCFRSRGYTFPLPSLPPSRYSSSLGLVLRQPKIPVTLPRVHRRSRGLPLYENSTPANERHEPTACPPFQRVESAVCTPEPVEVRKQTVMGPYEEFPTRPSCHCLCILRVVCEIHRCPNPSNVCWLRSSAVKPHRRGWQPQRERES